MSTKGERCQIFDLFKKKRTLRMVQIHESTIHRIFAVCLVLMEAIFLCFNLKPDDYNLATTILVHKLSQLHKTLIHVQ